MEKKKNSKADLEKSRSIFFLVGLVLALGAVFAAFNISTKTSMVDGLERIDGINFEEEEVMLIRPEEKKEVIQPKPKQVVEILSIVDDKEETTDEPIFSNEADETTEVEFVQAVVLEKEKEKDVPVIFASKMPVFPGGDIGLMKYIADNINYPNIAREQGIEGKVYVRFCVTKFGTVNRVSIARGADPILDKEAIRVVKKLPKWEPGENGGRKVSVWYTVPINFQLK